MIKLVKTTLKIIIRNCIGDLRKVCDLAKIGRGRLEIIQGISKSVEAQPRPIWKYRG